jgi:hypothetical protein
MAMPSTARLLETRKAACQQGVCGHERLGGVF